MGLFSKSTSEEYINKAIEKFFNPHRSPFTSYVEIQDLLYKAEKLDQNNAEIYFLKGWVNNHYDYYDTAIIEINKAIKLKPNYPDAYYNRGFAKFQKNDFTGALADYEMAIRLNPNFSEAIEDKKKLLILMDKKNNNPNLM